MELFERVKYLAKNLAGSETKLAALLGLPQRTFSNYLTKKSQRNLWDLLPCILETFPQIRREWLYFGEGEVERIARAEVASMLETAHDVGKYSPAMQVKVLHTPDMDKVVLNKGEERSSQYSAYLKNENTLLREMLADKIKIIALQDEMLQRCKVSPSTMTK